MSTRRHSGLKDCGTKKTKNEYKRGPAPTSSYPSVMSLDGAASVELDEAIRAAIEKDRHALHTTMPGLVVNYNATTQRADIQPVIRAINGGDTDAAPEDHPLIPNVPVRFPRGGGFMVTFPLVPGDHVDLHFQEADASAWRTSGQTSDPLQTVRHSMSFAYATPGACTEDDTPVDTSTTDLIIGKDNSVYQVRIHPSGGSPYIALGKGATDFVALASLVNARLDAIQTKFNAHTHAVAGAVASAPIPALQETGTNAVGSTKVKSL